MDKTHLTLEEAENIVDNMYQKRWEECGIDDGNTIHMGNLDKLEYTELEKASILLLRTELRLKKENQQLKSKLEASEKARNKCSSIIKMLGKFDGETCTRSLKLWKADFNELINILDVDKGE